MIIEILAYIIIPIMIILWFIMIIISKFELIRLKRGYKPEDDNTGRETIVGRAEQIIRDDDKPTKRKYLPLPTTNSNAEVERDIIVYRKGVGKAEEGKHERIHEEVGEY